MGMAYLRLLDRGAGSSRKPVCDEEVETGPEAVGWITKPFFFLRNG
jgi:hypothetical protein